MRTNEDKETMTTTKETKMRLRSKDAIWKIFLLLLVCALCCAKTAQAERESNLRNCKTAAGWVGDQRKQCRTEYVDGAVVELVEEEDKSC